MGNYVQWTENNDWEGESWSFYIPVGGNEKAIAFLREVIQQLNLTDLYELPEDLIPESEVDALVKHGGEGYMGFHNKMEGKIIIDNLAGIMNPDVFTDTFYKGGLDKIGLK